MLNKTTEFAMRAFACSGLFAVAVWLGTYVSAA